MSVVVIMGLPSSSLTHRPHRIMVFGRPGSGKTTWARALSSTLNLPLFHLDAVFFTDHWVERDYAEFLQIQQTYVAQSRWLIDGNATRSLQIRADRADLIVYFHRSPWLCAYRIFKRLFLSRDASIQDRAPNCPERFSLKLFRYMWSFPSRVQGFCLSLPLLYPSTPYVLVSSNHQAQALLTFLQSLPEKELLRDLSQDGA